MLCSQEDRSASEPLQGVFNLDPLAEPDPRTVTGLHQHYVDELQTDTEDMTWEFGVGLTRRIVEVNS